MENQDYQGEERRKYPRLDANYIISYRVLEKSDDFDLTQTRNVSLGGAFITTNKQYASGTVLELVVRVPFKEQRVTVKGEVVDSKEAVKNIMYETRIKFIDMPQGFLDEFDKFLKELQEEE